MKFVSFMIAVAAAALSGCQTPATSPAAGGQVTTGSRASDYRQPSRSASVADEAVSPAPRAQVARPTTAPESSQPPTGRRCRVYLRRDALGMAGAAPLAPNLDAPLQRGTVVAGTLDQVSDSWIVLKGESGRVWIPRNVVLMIEMMDR